MMRSATLDGTVRGGLPGAAVWRSVPAMRGAGWARQGCRRRVGFTLIELMVVITIMAVLAAMLLPALGKARFAARKAICVSHYRRMGVALGAYANDNQDNLPAFYTGGWAGNPWDSNAGYYYAMIQYTGTEDVFWCPVPQSRFIRFTIGGVLTYFGSYAEAVASGSFLDDSPTLRGGTPYQSGNHHRIWFARPTPQGGGMWTDEPGQWAQLYQPGGYNFAGVRRLSQREGRENPILADETLGYYVTPPLNQLTTASAAAAAAAAASAPGFKYLRMSHTWAGQPDSNTALWPDGSVEVVRLEDMRCGCPYGVWSGWR